MNRAVTLATPMALPDTQQEVLVRAMRVGLRTALGVLGDREAAAEVAQEVAIVAYVHDLDDHAIATALGCRRGTVRSLLSRGLSTLREQTDLDEGMTS